MASLLGSALRLHGGMDRWQRVSLIRARLLAHRMPPAEDVWNLFDLQASTRLPVVCLEHRSPDGLISSYENGSLAFYGHSGQRLATPDLSGTHGRLDDDVRTVFGLSGFIWLALNAPFILATSGFDPQVVEPSGSKRRGRLCVLSPEPLGGRARPLIAAFASSGLLRALHQRADGAGGPETTSVPTEYVLERGLLVARRHRMRLRRSGEQPSHLNLMIEAITLG
ncbi:hypothetical protein SAMN02800694_2807 [Luteibacter sp. UNCMF331Sha3.1]|uniref:hypothetical protein n=1 Tax=Luteibacter sp. UNCMF331Sha3.1 TaxID=1502760 RepID=UPI0008CAC340|nr:hypothetical protein [Luteibacter sp. UNCMF331Sha3.1]SEN11242.1 hypothetical protein SAMN02800694_2807 [Luteibacter sp. UNCMF331Sha3.1]